MPPKSSRTWTTLSSSGREAGAKAGACDPDPRLSSVQAVLFDLDGTLIDTISLILASMRHATQTVLGEQFDDEQLLCNVGIPLLTQMRTFSEAHAEELVRTYREHNHVVHDEMIREYPGTAEALQVLGERGLPMGVVTSKSRAVAIRGMDLFGLRDHFGVVVCADDVEKHKPDPYPIRFAARNLGVSAERCVYVGDSPHDVAAANGAGAISVAALWGAFSATALAQARPRFTVADISDLPPLLFGGRV